MLYELATGRPAFQGKTSAELVGSILHTEPIRPSELNPRIPAALEQIILRALQKDRRARYQSASEMGADLKALAAADRRKLFRVMAVSLALLLIAGTVAAWWDVRVSRVRWARNEAVPRARLLAESGSTPAALALLRQAERWLPHDSEIEKIRRVYAMTAIIETSPPGASPNPPTISSDEP